MTPTRIDLRTLGAAFARGPDGAMLSGLGAKGLAVLVFLALQPGQAATRDVLVDMLWGRGTPDQGRASLRQELRRMKRALGDLFEDCVDTPGGQIALRPGTVACDYLAAERACEARDTAGLSALLDGYGGPFLAPLSVPEIAFQDWTAERNSHLETIVTDGLLRLMLLDEGAGRLDRAAAAARALLEIDPLQEDVHAALVRLHVAGGRVRQARKQIEAATAVFLDELGEPPETDLEALIPAAGEARPAVTRDRAAATAPPPQRGGAPARPADVSDRPLVALQAAPFEPGAPNDPAMLGALRAAVLDQFGALSFMRIQDAAALSALGAELLTERADYAAVVALETPGPGEAAAARLSFARRGDGEVAAHRRLVWPVEAEVAPAAGLGPALAGALAADLLEAEAARGAPGGPGAEEDGAWARLMAARRAALSGDADALDAAREAREAEGRDGAGDPAATLHLAMLHLAEAARGLSPAPRDAAFRGRETALRALRRAPGDPWAQHLYGVGLALMQDMTGARRHQMQALAGTPGFARAMAETARLLALAGDVHEADAWTARAVLLAPGGAEASDWRRLPALARFAAGDPAGALTALEMARADESGRPFDALLAGACARELGRASPPLPAEARASLDPATLSLAFGFADPTRLAALLAPISEAAETAEA